MRDGFIHRTMKGIKKNQDEKYWVESFKEGDPEALAYFFDLHYKSLCYFAGRLIGDEAEAEDIVADCFLKVWKGDRQIETAQNVKAFLYISCRNACTDYFRKLKVKTAAQEHTYRQLEKGEEGVFYEVVKADVMEILSVEIEALPEKHKEVFKLIYFDHKKTDEVAEELGLSVKTVRNYKALAVEMIKNSIIKKGLTDALYIAMILFLEGRKHF